MSGQGDGQGIGSELPRSSIVFLFFGGQLPCNSAADDCAQTPPALDFPIMSKVILLLIGSNIFMTIAWYGHLKLRWLDGKPLIVAILVAWGVAFFEYCLQVPANRLGYTTGHLSGYQLKIIQEVVTLSVFIVFAWLVLKERLTWNYALSFAC